MRYPVGNLHRQTDFSSAHAYRLKESGTSSLRLFCICKSSFSCAKQLQIAATRANNRLQRRLSCAHAKRLSRFGPVYPQLTLPFVQKHRTPATPYPQPNLGTDYPEAWLWDAMPFRIRSKSRNTATGPPLQLRDRQIVRLALRNPDRPAIPAKEQFQTG